MSRVEVVAGVVQKGDEFLITRRGPHESFAGGWEFPGGKLKKGESHESCIQRELFEELGIIVDVGNKCETVEYQYDTFMLYMTAYYCSIREGEIKLLVHDEFKWVHAQNLLNFNFLPADIPIAQKIIKELE